MKTALYQNKMIHIDHINRENYQKIFDEGKKGLYKCPNCGENVRFYLGIKHEPHFFHIIKSNTKCVDKSLPMMEQGVEEIKFREQNGFRIPTSRSISVLPKQELFKQKHFVKASVTFIKKHIEEPSYSSNYLNLLKNADIYLDTSQAKAVTHFEGPLLVVAGAGSGKTRVLTTRTAFLIHEKQIDPKTIMLVTFTAKASAEMKARLLLYPGMNQQIVNKLVAGTFHSLFYRILTFHFPNKWNTDKLIKYEWQREQILKEGGRELQLDEKEFAFDTALQQIGFWKNSLLNPNNIKADSDWEEKVLFLYNQYEQYKQLHDLFDFDDMLSGCYELFLHDPSLLELYQKRFHFFLIDEFQDVNKVQYELIKLLSSNRKNVCAVGDDDQAIYAFRGSDPQFLLHFEKDFPKAKIVVLDQNYRSSHEIVSTANEIIIGNKQRRAKKMMAQFQNQLPPTLFYPFDEEEEATMIVTDIQEKIENGANPKDFAILFRTNTGSRAVFERLANSSLPFRIEYDSESFYNRFIVKSMLGYLKLSINEEDQLAIKEILPTLFVKKNILQDLKANSILNDCSLLECLSNIKTGFSFQERKLAKIAPTIRTLSNLTPLQAIDKVENELGYHEFIKKRGNEGNKWEKGSEDIRDLKVVAKNFSTIQELLDHTEHMIAMNKEMKKQRYKEQDTITLTTIHRAKGLEYEYVYILGVVDGSIPHDYALEAFRNEDPSFLEEERRLLYVAATRARQDLYISIPQKRRGKKTYPSRFLNNIRK